MPLRIIYDQWSYLAMNKVIIDAPELKYTADFHLYIIAQRMRELREQNTIGAGTALINAINDAYSDNRNEGGQPYFVDVENGSVRFDIVYEGFVGKSVGVIDYRVGDVNIVFMICQSDEKDCVIGFSCLGIAGNKWNATFIGRKNGGLKDMNNGLVWAILDGYLTLYESMQIDIYMPLLHLKDPTLHLRKKIKLDEGKVQRCMDLLEANEERLHNHTWFELSIPLQLKHKFGLDKIRIYDEHHESQSVAGEAMRFSTIELYTLDSSKSNFTTPTGRSVFSCLSWQQVLQFLINSGISEALSISVKE